MEEYSKIDDFIKKVKNIHGNKYDYSEVFYFRVREKIKIKCNVCGNVFYQRVDAHLSGQGCPECKKRNLRKDRAKSKDEFIRDAEKVHGKKYDYSGVNYTNAKTKVEIVCPKHGGFFVTPHNHLKGRGCPKCGKDKWKQTMLERYGVDHPMKSSFIFHKVVASNLEKYGVEYFMTTPDFREKSEFTCKQRYGNSSFSKTSMFLEKSQETKRKNGTFNTSKIQDELYLKLKEKFGEKGVERERQDKRYPFSCDFYIKSLDLFVELNAFWTHGGHWFDENSEEDVEKLENWKQKDTKFYQNAIDTWTQRDVNKRNCAKMNNLNYVVLWNKEDIDNWFNQGYPIRKDWK